MDLPPFLQPIQPSKGLPASDSDLYSHAIFKHSDHLGSAHAIWWPSSSPVHEKTTAILFVPGNPGLCSFYIDFLSEIHASSPNLAILAHAHLGHTPQAIIDQDIFRNPESVKLEAQVQSVIEAFDAIKYTLTKRIVLISHSIGTYIVLQVLKARPEFAASFLLFPTICNIAMSPNGKTLSKFFYPPFPFVASVISPLHRLIPLSMIFSDWPALKLRVLLNLLRSPAAVYATLTMAHDEMATVTSLDISVMKEHKDRIWMYFGEHDMWVGDNREVITNNFDFDDGSSRVVHGESGVPHAFCINHSRKVAIQCISWLQSSSLV